MPHSFDAASKHLIETEPRDWLALAGFPVPDSPADVSIVDADLSTVVTTAADKLIRVDHSPGHSGPYLAHIEFQSSPDPTLDARVLRYNVLGRHRHGLPVWSAVFLLRPQALVPGVSGQVIGRLAGVSHLDFAYQLVRVWELPTALILTGGVGTLALAPISAVDVADLPPVIASVQHRLADEMPTPAGKDMLTAMRVLMGLRYQDQITETLMQSISEMEDSVEWQKIFRRGKMQGVLEGKLEGKLEGRLEGELEGQLKGERNSLVRQGTFKFGPPTAELLHRLTIIKDLDVLVGLSERLLTSSSWEDLLGS